MRKAKIELEMLTNTHIDHNKLTVRDFMPDFVEKYGTKKWGTSYYSSSLKLLENYVYPYIGDLEITKITVKTVDDYYDFLMKDCEPVANKGKPKRKNVSASTIADIHKLLRCAFNIAKKWQLISKNPFIDAIVPEYKHVIRDTLSPDEISRIMEKTDNENDYDLYMMHCAISLAFACSLRGGEIGGLQWTDIVDYEERILHVSKTIDRVNKEALKKIPKTDVYFTFPDYIPGNKSVKVLKNTKTDGSNRTIYIPEAVMEMLHKLKKMQEDMKELFGTDGYADYGLIICQANGRPVMTEHLNKRFHEVLKDMGLKQVVFHSLRASSTTYKLRISNGDIKSVQGDNGQHDPSMVTKQYSRIMDEDRKRLSDKMDSKFYGRKKSEERPASSKEELMQILKDHPELISELMKEMQTA